MKENSIDRKLAEEKKPIKQNEGFKISEKPEKSLR